jgi:hypothetical protein
MASRPCTAICADGSPCEAWAVRGSDPALCVARGGGRWPVGAPAGNTNALRHGYYTGPELPEDCTIDAIIDMLYHKQIALDDFIDQILSIGQPAVEELAHLLKIHGQNASRLGRLLRDRPVLSQQLGVSITDGWVVVPFLSSQVLALRRLPYPPPSDKILCRLLPSMTHGARLQHIRS